MTWGKGGTGVASSTAPRGDPRGGHAAGLHCPGSQQLLRAAPAPPPGHPRHTGRPSVRRPRPPVPVDDPGAQDHARVGEVPHHRLLGQLLALDVPARQQVDARHLGHGGRHEDKARDARRRRLLHHGRVSCAVDLHAARGGAEAVWLALRWCLAAGAPPQGMALCATKEEARRAALAAAGLAGVPARARPMFLGRPCSAP
jgi:hypothetical protein